MAVLVLCFYIAVSFGFILWDAKVGFGFEWDGDDYPPLILAAIFWWVTIPYASISKFIDHLDKVKEDRKKKEAVRIRIKVEEEQSIKTALEEVDREVAEFTEKLKMSAGK